jgi:hypothetical protein
MHKISRKTIQDLAAELVEFCIHEDTEMIHKKALEVYEQSVILKYKEKNEEISLPSKTKEEVAETVFEPVKETSGKIDKEVEEDVSIEDRIKEIMKNAEANLTSYRKKAPDEVIQAEEPEMPNKKALPTLSMEEEMKDSMNADLALDLFEKADKIENAKKSLNDKLSQEQIQVGLNDRIAFVKHLFEGSLEDFNRVLSQLNTFENEGEAKDFLEKMVKSDYDWSEKEVYEERFVQLIERRFL